MLPMVEATTLLLNQRLLSLFLLQHPPRDRWRWFHQLIILINIIIIINKFAMLYVSSMAGLDLISKGEVILTIEATIYYTFFMCDISHCFYLLLERRAMNNLLTTLEDMFQELRKITGLNCFQKAIRPYDSAARWITIGFTMFWIYISITWSIASLITNVRSPKMANHTLKQVLPFPSKYPFDTTNYYGILYFLGSLAVTNTTMQVSFIDSIFVTLMLFFVFLFKQCIGVIKKCVENREETDNERPSLTECLILHQKLIK